MSTQSFSPLPEIKALTSLRFIAALYVFLFHIHIRWPLTDISFFSRILSQGAVGMSIFFMLSGFILAYRYSDEIINIKEYAVNRFAKIYPVYFVAALVTIPWIGASFAAAGTSPTALKIGTLVTANLFVLQGWFSPMFPLWNVGASWSISVEFFLYTMFPALMFLMRNNSAKITLIIIATAYFLSMLPGAVHLAYPEGTGYFYSLPLFRLSEFSIGIALFLLSKKIVFSPRKLDISLTIALLGLIAYLGLEGKSMPLYITHNWLVIPVIGISLLALSNNNTTSSKLMSSHSTVWLGKISYCFYSFQALLLTPMIFHGDKLKTLIPAFENHLILALGAFIALTIISAIGYTFIEEPMRKKIRRKFSPNET